MSTFNEWADPLYERIEFLEAEVARLTVALQKQQSDLSWERNPDRMGGVFTQQEIDDARRGGPGGWY